MPATLLPQALLTSEQAAEFLNTTPGNLAVWRCKRTVQIPYIKIGKCVRYRLADLERYLAQQTVGGDSDNEAQ